MKNKKMFLLKAEELNGLDHRANVIQKRIYANT